MSPYSLINPGIVRLLHSPAHGLLSRRLMTVSYQGCKSGKGYCIPVSYYRDEGTVYCFTNGSWRFNFKRQARVVLRLRGKDCAALGQVDNAAREQQVDIMTAYFNAVPQDRKFYGVTSDDGGQPVRSQVELATHRVDIIRFELRGN